ncbi:hypothetical protein, partial [Actimicrobium sp. CCI2.3]|uniref:hypothetical protein n=1 Tax=Actimicrobium sp. CCI2.3 TaxID=3048616 RepID=UPI002B24ABA7
FENKICWRRNQPFSFLGSALFSGSLEKTFLELVQLTWLQFMGGESVEKVPNKEQEKTRGSRQRLVLK